MRHILTSVVLLVFLFPSLASGEMMEDLVERDGLIYKKFTDVPFNGKVTGQYQGELRDGILEGYWVRYRDDGQLRDKGTYKNGERDGPWVSYNKDGQLSYKETYKDGEMHGPYADYWSNGQLWEEGTYKDGKKDGPWVGYNKDGTVDDELTGTYVDGVKVD